MTFGSQTVTLVDLTFGDPDKFGVKEKIPASTDVAGCLFRPLSGEEIVSDTDVIITPYKCTAPPVDAALAADATWELVYSGQTFRITSVEPKPDFSGAIDHVTIICERHIA
jgi:hypothetical protein